MVKRAPPNLPSLDDLTIAHGPTTGTPQDKRRRVASPGLRVYGALAKIRNEVDEGNMKGHPLKRVMMDEFFEFSVARGHGRDSNYDGFEGQTTGSMQMRMNDNRQGLTPEQKERFDGLKIKTEHYVIVPGALIIDPKYRTNTKMLAKIMAAVQQAGFDAKEVFQLQREVARDIVCEATIDGIISCTTIDEVTRRELFETVVGPVIVPKFDGSLAEAWDLVRQVLLPTEAEAKAAAKAAAREAKRAPKPPIGKPGKPVGNANGNPAPAAPKRGSSEFALALRTSLALEDAAAGSVPVAKRMKLLSATKPRSSAKRPRA